MNHTWKCTTEGTNREGKTWATVVTVTCEFHESFGKAMYESFDLLTSGRAIYGQPGSCKGPYMIHKCLIEEVKQ